MKHILLSLTLVLFSLYGFSQTDGISYQAVIIDNNPQEIPGVDIPSNSLTSVDVSVQFSIINNINVTEYQEMHLTTTDAFGMINLMIGQGTPATGTFNEIYWSEEKFLKVEIDLNDGNGLVEFSFQNLTYIPYVKHREIIATSTLDVDGATNLNNSLTVNNQSSTLLSGDLTVEGVVSFDGGLDVGGNAVFYADLTVDGATYLNDILEVEGETLINNNLTVTGISDFERIETSGLNVKADSLNYVATFENINTGNGDGIKIRLGKNGSKNNAALKLIDQKLVEDFIGQVQQSDLDAMMALFGPGTPDYAYLINMQIPSGDEVLELAGAVAATACILGQTISNTLIKGINDTLGLPIDLGPLGDLGPIGNVNFGCDTFGAPLSLPNFSFDDIADPLTNENVFIEFTDANDKHVGAIKAESITDWVQDYFDKVYLYELYSTMKGLDKMKLIQEAKRVAAKTAKGYFEIGVEYSSGNGDYAEWLERLDANEDISTGDIVAVKGGKITKNLVDAEQVMAVSHRPIVLGNIPAAGKGYLGNNIAFMGQIPVKVMGAVSSGDYIVGKGIIKGFGVAMSPKDMTLEDFKYSVGRSWDTNLDSGPKMVNTVVGVHNGDYLNVLKRYEAKFKESEARLETVEAKVDKLTEIIIKNKSL